LAIFTSLIFHFKSAIMLYSLLVLLFPVLLFPVLLVPVLLLAPVLLVPVYLFPVLLFPVLLFPVLLFLVLLFLVLLFPVLSVLLFLMFSLNSAANNGAVYSRGKLSIVPNIPAIKSFVKYSALAILTVLICGDLSCWSSPAVSLKRFAFRFANLVFFICYGWTRMSEFPLGIEKDV
jgi:hypothetical protein